MVKGLLERFLKQSVGSKLEVGEEHVKADKGFKESSERVLQIKLFQMVLSEEYLYTSYTCIYIYYCKTGNFSARDRPYQPVRREGRYQG